MNPHVLVMGVGRSGTSTVARILNNCFGVCMGHDFSKTTPAQPNGTFDSRSVNLATKKLLREGNTKNWLDVYGNMHNGCKSELHGVKVTHLAGMTPVMLRGINPKLVIVCTRDRKLTIASLQKWRGVISQAASSYTNADTWEAFFDNRTRAIERMEQGTRYPFYTVWFGHKLRDDAEIVSELDTIFLQLLKKKDEHD